MAAAMGGAWAVLRLLHQFVFRVRLLSHSLRRRGSSSSQVLVVGTEGTRRPHGLSVAMGDSHIAVYQRRDCSPRHLVITRPGPPRDRGGVLALDMIAQISKTQDLPDGGWTGG